MLCFACGRLGHRKGNCPVVIRSNVGTTNSPFSQSSPRNQSPSVSLGSDQSSEPLKERATPNADLALEHVSKAYGE